MPESSFDDGTVKAYKNDTATVRFTFLPIVELSGDFSYDYANGTVNVIMPDTSDTKLNLSAKIKWRGGMTNTDDAHKRNYHIKFLDSEGNKKDRRFFGLRKDNNWLLDACQIDRSRIRNRVANELWNDFASKPYYFDNEPNVLTSTRGQYVEVFLNGEYRGLYCMMENMDRAQLNLKKYDDDLTIHGQLWKTKDFKYTGFWDYADYDNSQEMWGGFETKYPDIEDVNPTDYSTIYNAVAFTCNSTDEEFCKDFSKYFDKDPLVDYFMFEHVLWANDNYAGKNMFWACYDSKENKKITPIIWDLDCTVGQSPSRTEPHSLSVAPENVDTLFSTKFFSRAYWLNPDGYRDTLLTRYNRLRHSIFRTDSLQARYNRYFDMLEKSGAFKRESQRWSGDSDIGCDTLNFAEERKYINDWLEVHLQCLDEKIFPLSDGISDVVIAQRSDTNIYDIIGRKHNNYESLSPGLYIRNGRKFIVK